MPGSLLDLAFEGKVVIENPDIPAELEDKVRMTIRNCPEGALRFRQGLCDQVPGRPFLELFGLAEERLPEFLRISDTFCRVNDEEVRKANLLEVFVVLEELFRGKMDDPGAFMIAP